MFKKLFNFVSPLYCENDSLSLGRVAFWMLLSPALKIWVQGDEIKTYHFYTIVIFLVYNFSKKVPLFISLIEAWKGIAPTKNIVEVKE